MALEKAGQQLITQTLPEKSGFLFFSSSTPFEYQCCIRVIYENSRPPGVRPLANEQQSMEHTFKFRRATPPNPSEQGWIHVVSGSL